MLNASLALDSMAAVPASPAYVPHDELVLDWPSERAAALVESSVELGPSEVVLLAASSRVFGPLVWALLQGVHSHVRTASTRLITLRDVVVAREGICSRDEAARCGVAVDDLPRLERAVHLQWRGYTVFGHGLIDQLPRLALLGEHGMLGSPILLGPKGVARFRPFASLAERAFGPLTLLETHDGPSYVCDSLVTVSVPRAGNCPASLVRQKALELARQGAGVTPDHRRRRRIWISRTAWWDQRRMLENEAELGNLAASLGYEVVRPETLPVEEMISLANEAEVIAGARGSGLHFSLYSETVERVVCLLDAEQSFTGMELAQAGLCLVAGQRCDFVAGPRIAASEKRERFAVSEQLLSGVLAS